MKVELLNNDELKDGKYFKRWGNFTSVCYAKGVPTASGMSKDRSKIGQHCLSTGHLSGCRHIYFDFLISGVSRACTHQFVRHNVGIVFNQQSLRYVDPFAAAGVGFSFPSEADGDIILDEIYETAYAQSEKMYRSIYDRVLKLTKNEERARECARMILPLGVQSTISCSMNLEALINFCKKRECARAEEEIRQLAIAFHQTIVEVIPELEPFLGPPCEIGLKCKEKSCPKNK